MATTNTNPVPDSNPMTALFADMSKPVDTSEVFVGMTNLRVDCQLGCFKTPANEALGGSMTFSLIDAWGVKCASLGDSKDKDWLVMTVIAWDGVDRYNKSLLYFVMKTYSMANLLAIFKDLRAANRSDNAVYWYLYKAFFVQKEKTVEGKAAKFYALNFQVCDKLTGGQMELSRPVFNTVWHPDWKQAVMEEIPFTFKPGAINAQLLPADDGHNAAYQGD